MLKRVQKRIHKREKEEALGLDDETKEILGFNDTDSDESESSGFDTDEGGEDSAEENTLEENGDEEEVLGAHEDWEDDDDSDTEDELPSITVQEALKDPIYISSLDAGEWGCAICPGKVLKGSKMMVIHREAQAHKRRFVQFSKLAKSASPSSSAAAVMKSQPTLAVPQHPEGKSKRSEKREKTALIRKERRLKQKAKAKASKEKAHTEQSADIALDEAKRKRKRETEKAPIPSKVTPSSPSTETTSQVKKKKQKRGTATKETSLSK